MLETDREREKNINVEYKVSLLDVKSGKVLMEGKWIPSKSFVKNFMAFLFANFKCGEVSATDINGNAITFKVSTGYHDQTATAIIANGGAGDSNRGIVVGKGSTPVTNNDYALEEQCVHGEGADQLLHSATSWSGLAEEDGYIVATAERVFTNNSGATITLNEIGMYVLEWRGGYASPYEEVGTVMILRDVISALTVNHLQAAGVQYKIKTKA